MFNFIKNAKFVINGWAILVMIGASTLGTALLIKARDLDTIMVANSVCTFGKADADQVVNVVVTCADGENQIKTITHDAKIVTLLFNTRRDTLVCNINDSNDIIDCKE